MYSKLKCNELDNPEENSPEFIEHCMEQYPMMQLT